MAILPSLHMKYSLLFFWVSFDATYASDDTVLWDKTGYDAYMLSSLKLFYLQLLVDVLC
jgi:hypothetical protein